MADQQLQGGDGGCAERERKVKVSHKACLGFGQVAENREQRETDREVGQGGGVKRRVVPV